MTGTLCAIEGCGGVVAKRTLCRRHYYRAWKDGQLAEWPTMRPERDGWVNPLVCVCATPDADPRRDFGMCSRCKRKPLALMAARS